ncbi:MAG: hypothetical protein AB1756_04415 [Acidobacteriota bacterium]
MEWPRSRGSLNEPIFWQIILVVILLAGPLTWTMNTVWLLPAALMLFMPVWEEAPGGAWLRVLAIFALIAAAIPDQYVFDFCQPFQVVLSLKYVLAELLMLVALLGVMKAYKK